MTEKEMIRHWAQTWKTVGPELELIRLREVREEDNLLAMRQLAPLFEHGVRTRPPDDSPGMVQMQRYLAKLRP